MIAALLSWSLRHRLLVLLGACLLSLIGFLLVRSMNVDVFPDLTAPSVTVMTEAHGLSSTEVEKLVTYPLEVALNGSPGVRRIRSASSSGVSIVWVEFDWDVAILEARQIVGERLPQAANQLPKEAGPPMMAPTASIMGEIMLLAVTSDSLSPMDLRTICDWEIQPRIKALPGVAHVVVLGGAHRQVQILADPVKMANYQVSPMDVLEAVEAANRNRSGGVVETYGKRYLIQGHGRMHTLDQLERAVIPGAVHPPLRISDVADVRIGPADRLGTASLNGRSAVILTIAKQPGTNTLALTRELDQLSAAIKAEIPASVQWHDQVFRQADFIDASIDNLRETLLEGALFVVLVLFLFLMNGRTTFISLMAIPVSLFAAVIALHALGLTLNTMSLGGLAIAIGVLVDDAIIDVENVYRRLRQNAALPPERRSSTQVVVREGSLEIRSSIVTATMIVLASFLPLFFLEGMEGRLLRPLGIAFVVSVIASLAVAVTLTPVLCAYLLGDKGQGRRDSELTAVEQWIRNRYRYLLNSVLPRSGWVLGLTTFAFIATMLSFSRVGRGFLPPFHEGSLVISAVAQPGISLEESQRIGQDIERRLLAMPEVEIVARRTGRAESDEHAQGVNASEIDVPFHLQGKSASQFMGAVRERLSGIPGVNITLGQPIGHRIDHMLSGTRANIAIKVFGPDLDALHRLAKEIAAAVEGIDGLVDVSTEQRFAVPEWRIIPNREALAAHGMTVDDLMRQVDIGFAGEHAGDLHEGHRRFDLVVRFPEEARASWPAIRMLPIRTPAGATVPLHTIAELVSASSPDVIQRESVERKVVVSANVEGRDLRGAVLAVERVLANDLVLPSGYRIEYGGQFESEREASRRLSLAAGFALAIIYLLLFLEFRQHRLALAILANLPLALIGGAWVVLLGPGSLDISATIGFISLIGISARNGILLVSRYEALREQGRYGLELIVQGALDRLNPILMTACTTGLALIPLALKAGQPGTEIQSPMALVILGGLVSSTILNLMVVPALYHRFRSGPVRHVA